MSTLSAEQMLSHSKRDADRLISRVAVCCNVLQICEGRLSGLIYKSKEPVKVIVFKGSDLRFYSVAVVVIMDRAEDCAVTDRPANLRDSCIEVSRVYFGENFLAECAEAKSKSTAS